MTWEANLLADLKRDEGLRLKPYKDSVGKLTIGYGRNLEDRGITQQEAEHLLENDMAEVILDLGFQFPWFLHLSDNRKRALANMRFNLGMEGLMAFQRMLKALAEEEWDKAADEALDSKWRYQVGAMAERIAELIRNG